MADGPSAFSKQTRRNYQLGVINGFLYITAETVMDPTLVIVGFLSYLTDSPLLLGLVLPIRDGAWSLPQLWVSGFLQNFPRKVKFYQFSAVLRVVTWVIVALSLNLVYDKSTLLILFFVSFVISAFASGLGGLPFLEVVGKTIPAERRGEFFAWRFGLGGLGSLAGSAFVRWMLDENGPFSFPHNYGSLSIVFLILGGLSVLAFSLIHEPPDTLLLPRQSLGEQITRAFAVTKANRRYRAFLTLQILLILGGAATPFYAVYVQQNLGGSLSMTGIYLGIWTAANLLSNLFFGRLSRRRGNHPVIHIAIWAGVAVAASMLLITLVGRPMALSAAAAEAWLIPVFVLVGIRGSAMGVANNSLLLDIAPENDRSLYLGFTNTLMGSMLLLTGVSGVMVEILGYQALFGFTLFAYLVSIVAYRSVDRHSQPVTSPVISVQE